MAKYILKCIDDTNDAYGASVTYEFEANKITNISFHLAQFLRSAGYTWVENVEITKDENINNDSFNHIDDSSIENSVLYYGVGGSDRADAFSMEYEKNKK